jgi:predicted flap endonuclease-1-like 5' DNA nuclease
MANRTIAEVLKMHGEVVKSIEAQFEAPGKPKPVSHNFFLKQKEQRLTSMQARLTQAKADREAVLERIDRQIEGLSKKISLFEKEIEADRKNLKDRPVPVDPDPGPVVRPERDSLRRIRGVGEATEKRLKENGITRASQVARMDKARLAAILGISETRAVEFIKEAKRLR